MNKDEKMRVLSKKIPVLIAVAVLAMVVSFPKNCLSSEEKPRCKRQRTGNFTFRLHPFFYGGADLDIKVAYSATLNSSGTVKLDVVSVDADPWAYARLQCKLISTDIDQERNGISLELLTKAWLNGITEDALDNEAIAEYGPTQEPRIFKRFVASLSWDSKACPKITTVDESPRVEFEGHTIPKPSFATRIKEVQGDVLMKNEGTGQTHRPVPGTEIKPGDTIETKGGEVTFYMRASKIKVAAQTLVKITYDEFMPGPIKEGIKMVHGFLFAYAKKEKNSLKVATPNAICGVRGTSYTISHDKATTTTVVEVQDGVVSFSDPQNKKTVEVKAGMKSVIKGNGLPSDPVPIQ